MAFGKLGALGRGFGKLGAPLGGAGHPTPPGPTAPVLAMDPTWDTIQSTVKYQIDAAWADQDDLQFERQTTGGDWSAATITHHTVTTSEIGGTLIDLGFGVVPNGTYDARCKFKHFGGTYSGYSNVVSFTVATVGATNRLMWGTSQQLWSTDHLTWA